MRFHISHMKAGAREQKQSVIELSFVEEGTEMTRFKTIINPRLATPDSYTVECGGKKARFPKGEETDIGKWIESVWAE